MGILLIPDAMSNLVYPRGNVKNVKQLLDQNGILMAHWGNGTETPTQMTNFTQATNDKWSVCQKEVKKGVRRQYQLPGFVD